MTRLFQLAAVNACMLDAMRYVGVARCRGIVDVDVNAPDSTSLVEMARDTVLGCHMSERRNLCRAAIKDKVTACVKATSGRRFYRRWHFALKDDLLPSFPASAR